MSCVVHGNGIIPVRHRWEFCLEDDEVPSVNYLEVKEINENEWVQGKGLPLLWSGLEKLKGSECWPVPLIDCPV